MSVVHSESRDGGHASRGGERPCDDASSAGGRAHQDSAAGADVPRGEGEAGPRGGQVGRERKRHHHHRQADVYDHDGNDRLHQVGCYLHRGGYVLCGVSLFFGLFVF